MNRSSYLHQAVLGKSGSNLTDAGGMQDVNIPCSSVIFYCKASLNYWCTSTSGTFKLSPEIRRQQIEQRAPLHIHISVLDNGPASACFRKTLIAR